MSIHTTPNVPAISYFAPVDLANVFDNLTYTYDNGPYNNGWHATCTFTTSTLEIDRREVKLNDRILLATYTNLKTNGIYDVIQLEPYVVFRRSEDCDDIQDLNSGNFIFVKSGYFHYGAVFCIYNDRGAYGEIEDNGPIGVREIKLITSGVEQNYLRVPPGGLYIMGDGNGIDQFGTSGYFSFTDTFTGYKNLSFTLGDANRNINLTNGSIAPSVLGNSLIAQSTKLTALNTLGVKPFKVSWAGGASTHIYPLTGTATTDSVVANIVSITNTAERLVSVVPLANTINFNFSGDPGAVVLSVIKMQTV